MRSRLAIGLILIFIWLPTISLQAFEADSLNKKRLLLVTSAEVSTYVGGLAFLSLVWYSDHERVPFHYYDDSKGYLQMDKCGHAYSAYWESRVTGHLLKWAGVRPTTAAIIGGATGFLFQAPIEIFDGLYDGWGFSWSDIAANSFGAALYTTQELIWQEQRMLMKFSYSPSAYREIIPGYLGETHLESFFYDYNGHTYWLSGNLKALTRIEKLPPWLNLALGYSANGLLGEFDNPERYRGQPVPDIPRYRQWVLSLDVDFTRIPTKKKWLSAVFKTVNCIKVPFSALEYSRIHGLQFKPVYF